MKIIKSFWYFFQKPVVRMISGVLLSVLPTCYAASIGLLTLEPGFTYGCFYGIGMMISIRAIFDFFFRKGSEGKTF